MFESTEVLVAVSAFAGVLAANAAKWIYRRIDNHVKGTPNTIDDKIWKSVTEAIRLSKNG